ncbi:MAG: ATP-binding protein [Desulfuromonadaceae bacterium]
MQNVELRQSRHATQKLLEQYTDLYDFAPVGYLTLDHEGIILAANLTAAGLLGVERSRVTGLPFAQFVPVDARLFFSDFLGKVFASQGKESCEVALTREEHPPPFVQIEALACNSGQECRMALIDISRRRQLEEKLKILHTELASRAFELETANIALEAFNSSVSHDLRQPLTIISGYVQALQSMLGNGEDAQGKEYLQNICEGVESMNCLIEALLSFSSCIHTEMQRETVDLSVLAKAVAAELKLTEPKRQVTFKIAAGVTADGDADLLRVVLANLIGNAWKHSNMKEKAVIEFGETEVGGKRIFFVRDNGPGFDMAVADKLFLPFQRPPGTHVEGCGIGLATVERIVKRHGGKIWAESKPGEGATFFFSLTEMAPTPCPEDGAHTE